MTNSGIAFPLGSVPATSQRFPQEEWLKRGRRRSSDSQEDGKLAYRVRETIKGCCRCYQLGCVECKVLLFLVVVFFGGERFPKLE